MEAKKTKLENQFKEKAASDENNVKSQIFKGISIFVNGYTCMYTIYLLLCNVLMLQYIILDIKRSANLYTLFHFLI